MSKSPFAIADSSSLWASGRALEQEKKKETSVRLLQKTKEEKLRDELESQNAARADLQKQVWRLKRKLQKAEQEKDQLRQTIKALQKNATESTQIVKASPDSGNEISHSYLSLSLYINKALFSHITSKHSLTEDRLKQYQQQFEELFQLSDHPKIALEKLQELLYHISLHVIPITSSVPSISNSDRSPSSTSNQDERINRLEQKIERYKNLLKGNQNQHANTIQNCTQCSLFQNQIHSLVNERDTLVGYIQTYKEQQIKLQELVHQQQNQIPLLQQQLESSKRKVNEEQKKRQKLQEEIYSGKLVSQLDLISKRDEFKKHGKKLMDIQEELDTAISNSRRWEDEAKRLESRCNSLEIERDSWLHEQEMLNSQMKQLKDSLEIGGDNRAKLKIQNLEEEKMDLENKIKTWEEIGNDMRMAIAVQRTKMEGELGRLDDMVANLYLITKQKIAEFNGFLDFDDSPLEMNSPTRKLLHTNFDEEFDEESFQDDISLSPTYRELQKYPISGELSPEEEAEEAEEEEEEEEEEDNEGIIEEKEDYNPYNSGEEEHSEEHQDFEENNDEIDGNVSDFEFDL